MASVLARVMSRMRAVVGSTAWLYRRRARVEVSVALARGRYALWSRQTDQEMLSGAAGQGASLQSLISSFRTGGEFFFEPGHAALLAHEIDQLCSGWRCRVVADADRLLRRRVRVLSEDEVDLSERPGSVGILPWHEDFIHGYRWNPRKFFKRIDIPYGQADIKVPWELSRCHHLPILGMAFAATDDARYAQEVVAQIEDWIARNPVSFGVNWVSTMDVAIRAVNWLWAYRLIADGYPCTDAFVTQLLASLVRHARHIQSNIETYRLGITTNHTFADYVGLLFLGLLLPALREAHGWADTGREGILRCMREQVTEDSINYENSISYHGWYLDVAHAATSSQTGTAARFQRRFVRCSSGCWICFTVARAPMDSHRVGDCDDGRLLILRDISHGNHRITDICLRSVPMFVGRTSPQRPQVPPAASECRVDARPGARVQRTMGPLQTSHGGGVPSTRRPLRHRHHDTMPSSPRMRSVLEASATTSTTTSSASSFRVRNGHGRRSGSFVYTLT